MKQNFLEIISDKKDRVLRRVYYARSLWKRCF